MFLLTYYSETAAVLMLQGTNIYMEGLLVGLFLFVLNLFSFYMYVRLLAYSESRLQTQILHEQLNAYEHRITGIEDFQKQTAEMRHEFKNILFTLNIAAEQGNCEQVQQRTQELLGDFKRATPEYYTGISLIDAVIAYKAVRLRELGAVLDIQADSLDTEAPGGALALDIAAIMGIAMDNMIDACKLLRTRSTPVSCTIHQLKNALVIEVTNPLPAPLRYKNGEIQSTKTKSGHGLGLSALRRIAQKHGGEVTISDSGGTFSLSVMLFA
jgi:sensor histidine kinase regulating citrate/malate metabolism